MINHQFVTSGLVKRLGDTLYKVIKTNKPCRVCGKEIQPGQLYVPGPRHLGCGR